MDSKDSPKTFLIPPKIFITYKVDLCQPLSPAVEAAVPSSPMLRENVLNIQAFNPRMEVRCFDDTEAYEYIRDRYSAELATMFDKEPKVSFTTIHVKSIYIVSERHRTILVFFRVVEMSRV